MTSWRTVNKRKRLARRGPRTYNLFTTKALLRAYHHRYRDSVERFLFALDYDRISPGDTIAFDPVVTPRRLSSFIAPLTDGPKSKAARPAGFVETTWSKPDLIDLKYMRETRGFVTDYDSLSDRYRKD